MALISPQLWWVLSSIAWHTLRFLSHDLRKNNCANNILQILWFYCNKSQLERHPKEWQLLSSYLWSNRSRRRSTLFLRLFKVAWSTLRILSNIHYVHSFLEQSSHTWELTLDIIIFVTIGSSHLLVSEFVSSRSDLSKQKFIPLLFT